MRRPKESIAHPFKFRAITAAASILLATVTTVSAQQPTAQNAAQQLDAMRYAAEYDPKTVADVLKQGLAELNQQDQSLAAQLEDVSRRIDAGVTDRDTLARRNQLRAQRCGLAFTRGELYRRAAAAVPAGDAARNRYLEQAIQTYQSLRVGYIDLVIGQIGYIGESRAHRQAERPDEALRVLDPILSVPRQPGNDANEPLLRLALIEALEAQLMIAPGKAVEEADKLTQSSLFADQSELISQLAWVTARAAAQMALTQSQAGGDAQATKTMLNSAVTLLRSASVNHAAPAYERLQWLDRLDEAANEPIVTADERLAWAELLAAAGRQTRAMEQFELALADPSASLSESQWLTYASVLWREGQLIPAADALDRVLNRIAPDDPRRANILHWRASWLLSAMAEPSAAGELQIRTMDALKAVVESDAPLEVRQQMLRQWASMQGRSGGVESLHAFLSEHADLVLTDPHLQYIAAAAEWRVLRTRHSGATPWNDTSTAAVNDILTDLAACQKTADERREAELAASAALLRAQILVNEPLDDARSALAAIESQWSALAVSAALAGPATDLRLRLMLRLGMVDAAWHAMTQAIDAGQQANLSADLPLAIAELLADRYATSPPATRADLQQQVVRFANLALTLPAGRISETQRITRAAAAMLTVDAIADAQHLLNAMHAEAGAASSDQARINVGLMQAQAMQSRNQLDQMHAHLQSMTQQHPRSAQVWAAMGRCQTLLQQYGAAVESHRQARSLSPAGTDAWWRSTVDLIRAMRSAGNAADARDVLRVAEALYPAQRSATLAREIQQLRSDLNKTGR